MTSQLVTGINSTLTNTGANENLRLLQWSSSGFKPSSETSTAEKVTDMIKERVKDGQPGENTRDEDLQDIKSIRQANSLQITDLEQYIVRRCEGGQTGGLHPLTPASFTESDSGFAQWKVPCRRGHRWTGERRGAREGRTG